MRRQALTVLATTAWLLPATSFAQVLSPGPQPQLGVGRTPGITVTRTAPPAPQPAPSTNTQGPGRPGGRGPRPSPGPGVGTSDQFLAGPYTYAPRYGRFSGRNRIPAYGGYVPFGYSTYADPYPYTTYTTEQPFDRGDDGRLVLQVTPNTAQVFVDGFYVGVVNDTRDRGLWLEAGSHRVELRADGYETVTFDVRIAEGETVDYRRGLARETTTAEPVRRAAATPKAFYVIRGCYAGDSAPDAARLPPGCRAADVRVIPPVVSRTNR